AVPVSVSPSSSATPTAPTEIYTLSLHDALPIYVLGGVDQLHPVRRLACGPLDLLVALVADQQDVVVLAVEAVDLLVDLGDERARSEEHTSELQSRENLVCRLLLEKKNSNNAWSV